MRNRVALFVWLFLMVLPNILYGQDKDYYMVEIDRYRSYPSPTDNLGTEWYVSAAIEFVSDDLNHRYCMSLPNGVSGIDIKEIYIYLDFFPRQINVYLGSDFKKNNIVNDNNEIQIKQTIDGYFCYRDINGVLFKESKLKLTITKCTMTILEMEEMENYLCPQDIHLEFNFLPALDPILYIKNEKGEELIVKRIEHNLNTPYSATRQISVTVSLSAIFNHIGGYYKNYTIGVKVSMLPSSIEDGFVLEKEMPPFYPYYPLEDDKELYVQDSLLHIGDINIIYDSGISLRSDFFIDDNKGEQPLSKEQLKDGCFTKPLHGPYTITFSKKGYCSVLRYVFVPELSCHYVGNDKDSNVFWCDEDIRPAVSLNLKYPKGESDNFHFHYVTNNGLKVKKSIIGDRDQGIIVYEATDGKVTVLDPVKYNETEPKVCSMTKATFTTDKFLKTIDVSITSSDKKFIPVKINLEGKLKAYPNIELASDVAKDIFPHCNYSDAVLNFPKFKGGLSNGYYFQLNDEDSLPIPQTSSFVLDKSLKSFSVKIFDNFEGMRDTIGRLARSLDLGTFTVHRPPALQIIDSVSHNLQCHNDSSGSIEIKAVQRTYDDKELEYHWFKYPYTDELAFRSNKADHLPADSYRLVIFNDGCKDTSHYTITQPDTLLTSITSVTNAMCYGYHDGAITTETTGGTGQYTYAWSNGATTNDIDGLPIGRYYVTVTDEHGCEAYANDTITQPDDLINSLTPSYTICKGGELLIDDGKENMKDFDSYEWHLPDSTIVHDRPIVVTTAMPQGKYALMSKKDVPGKKGKYCFTTDSTLITFADNDLPIRFLVPTESFLGDTLVVAEDSEIDADYTWRYAFNPEMFTDYTDRMASPNVNQTYLYVNQSGNDTITMYAENGFCKASLSKSVTIINDYRPEDYDYTIASAGIFSRLLIGSNPNNGEFTLFANLTEESELDVRLYDVSRSRRIPLDFSKYKTPSDRYQIPFQGLGLRTGIYTLLISANCETKQIKFVVE